MGLTLLKFYFALSGIACCVTSSTTPASSESTSDAFVRLKSFVHAQPAVTHKIPPVLAQDGNLTIDLSYNPIQILYVDEVTQSVAVSSFILLHWYDTNLQWDPAQYGGLNKLVLTHKDIWTPLVYLLNSADSQEDVVRLPDPDTIELLWDGGILAYLAQKIVSSCYFDVTYFPFDKQNCSMLFQPVASGVNVVMRTVSFNLPLLELFSTHSSWTITSFSQSVVVWENETLRSSYVVTATIAIERRSTFFVINIITPIIVTSLMALLVFWIPPASGEKITFLVTMFVSTTVFLNLVSNMMPRSFSSLPRFNLFLVILVSENLLTFLATSMVLRCYRAEQEEEREKFQRAKKQLSLKGQTSGVSGRNRESGRSKSNSAKLSLVSDGDVSLPDPLTPSPEPCDVRDDQNTHRDSSAHLVPGQTPKSKEWYSSSAQLDKIFFCLFLCITLSLYCILFIP